MIAASEKLITEFCEHKMKNFQVNHGQCESIIIPKNIFPFKALSNYSIRPLTFWQQDSLLLAGPGIYPQIYHRTPCPEVLTCKGV